MQVIAYTVLDMNRTTRANEQPMTPEQARELRRLAKRIQSNSGASLPSLLTMKRACIFHDVTLVAGDPLLEIAAAGIED